MIRILISRCLLGETVRYDGRDNRLADPRLAQWLNEGRLVPICPEVAGGLPTPRPPAEQQADGRIVTINGQDVSDAFEQGARLALQLAQQNGCSLALLKARSPSCGNRQIYDGHFTGQLVAGQGVTAQWLTGHGIEVFNEGELDALQRRLEALEAAN